MVKERLRGWLRALATPRRLVPILLTGALIAALVEMSDISSVFHRWRALSLQAGLLTLGLAGVYLAVKGWQFGHLLKAAELGTDWRAQWVAFAVGEMTLLLPLGMYAQNYVLSKSRNQDFVRSAATTTAMHVLELFVLACVLAALPVYGWPQLRETLWGGIGACIVLILLLARFHPLREIAVRLGRRRNLIGKIARKGRDFIKELRMLGKPVVLLPNLLVTSVYLLALAIAFHQVGAAVGQHHLGFFQAVTIYAFGLLVAMMFGGLVSQLGTVELAGAAVASAMGLDVHDTFVMLIWFRLLWTVSVWLIAGAAVLALHRELSVPERRA